MKIIKTILYYIFIFPLVCLKNALDPNWWAGLVGEKSGLFAWARKKGEWQNKLTGWKWWAWQIVGGIIFVILVEWVLNKIGMTMLPWRMF